MASPSASPPRRATCRGAEPPFPSRRREGWAPLLAFGADFPHMRRRESGGRCPREPGQVGNEAATAISRRVVPAPTLPQYAVFLSLCDASAVTRMADLRLK